MKKFSIFGRRHRASSLVVTLLVLVVLSTIVVAFLQSMSVERLTAKSQANIYRSKLAAQAGMEAALRQISLATSNNPAYIVGQTYDAGNLGPILVIGQTNLTTASQLMPLISGDMAALNGYPASASSNLILNYINSRTNTNSTNTVNLNVRNLIEVTTDTNKYRASWVYLQNADGTLNSRYAYIITDEWGRINPRYHGDPTLSRTNATNWFPGAGVLPMYTGDVNFIASGSDATAMRNIATNTLYPPLTPLTIGQAFSSRANYDAKKHLITMDDTWSPDVIPADLPQGGRPKYNINDLATNSTNGATAEARATNIANIIMINLPSFGLRDLGLTDEDSTGRKYVNRLAANIVDYIDADSTPTTVNGGEPAGKEANPYVVLVGERNIWTGVTVSAAPPSWTVTIKTEFFVQVWNPYTVTVSGDAKFEVFSRQPLVFGGDATYGGGDLNDFVSATVPVGNIRPNEYKVINFGSVTQDFVSSADPTIQKPGWAATSSKSTGLNGHPQFRFRWNGSLVDMQRSSDPGGPVMVDPATSGLGRDQTTLTNMTTSIRWTFNPVPNNNPNTVADPRINWICQSDWGGGVNTLTLAQWQGRQTAEDFVTTWSYRDFVPKNSGTSGSSLASGSDDPTALPVKYSPADATNAPVYIKNGAMQSLGELGHIFDPIQVNDSGSNNPGSSSGGNVPSWNKPGGGYSLRIGQPELVYTSTNGKRAIELLDLFTVDSTNSFSTNYPVTRGRINVNTASLPVLEALFFNVSPTSDGNFASSVITSAKMTNVANAVIANRPYNKLSDLYKITPTLVTATNYVASFGGAIPNPAGLNNAYAEAKVFDRAREEVFAKIIESCTVQSRAFRLYVIGESLNSHTGKREGRSVLESVITVNDGIIGTNGVTNSGPQVKYLRWEN